jgi:hypothetical protein
VKKELLTICLIILISFSYCCIGDVFHDYGNYKREIEKNIDDENESMVLEFVENFNYSGVFNIERFENGDFTYANFVDTQVIEYYNQEYEKKKDSKAEHDIEFLYKADVYNITELRIIYDYDSDLNDYELKIYNGSNRILKIEGEILPKIIAIFNDTNFTLKDIEIDLELKFTAVFLVYLDFEYSDFWGPKAGRATIIEQIVVLDNDFQPLFIFIDAGHLMS